MPTEDFFDDSLEVGDLGAGDFMCGGHTLLCDCGRVEFAQSVAQFILFWLAVGEVFQTPKDGSARCIVAGNDETNNLKCVSMLREVSRILSNLVPYRGRPVYRLPTILLRKRPFSQHHQIHRRLDPCLISPVCLLIQPLHRLVHLLS